jgi:hypothetical protein
MIAFLNRITLKASVVLILILGAGAAMLMLGHNVVPNENRDFFNIGLGGWLAWTAMAVKRVLDGTDSGDAKNDTIAALSGAVVTAQTLPAATEDLAKDGKTP